MIKIRKGTQILSVPTTTFKEFYQADGWVQIVKKSELSPWEAQVRTASLQQLKKLATDRGIEVTGVSKRTLIAALLTAGE